MKRSMRSKTLATALAVAFSSALTFGLAPLASAASPTEYKWTGASSSTAGLAGCTTNCWSVPGNWTVSTDGGSTWAAATTAPQSTDNGGKGDNLLFDQTSLSANTTLTNDITGLTVGSISATVTTGSQYSYTYTVAGNGLTVTGGFTDFSGNGNAVNLSNDITFDGSQTIGSGSGSPSASITGGTTTVASGTLDVKDFFSSSSAFKVSSGTTVQFSNGSYLNGVVSGSGNIIVATPSSGSYPNSLTLTPTADNTFSGTITVQKGGQLYVSLDENKYSALGAAALTIEPGGQLYLRYSPTTPKTSDSLTVANSITMAGNGAGVFNQTKGAIVAGMYDNATGKYVYDGALTVTLSGNVALTADTALASIYNTATTYNFTGKLTQNGHALTAVPADQPTYGSTVVQVNGKQVASSSSSSTTASSASKKTAPKAPDTGFALTADNSGLTLGAVVLIAVLVAGLATKGRKLASKR